MSIFKSKSSFLALIINGKIAHIINPWFLIVDFDLETITVQKRNWYIIGRNKNTIAFKFIRNIAVKEYLFGADIMIKASGVNVVASFLPKNQVAEIRKLLFEYNRKHKGHLIFS